MHPITHGLAGWCFANVTPLDDARDRLLVTLGCVLPDLDGLGMVAGFLQEGRSGAAELFSRYHHVLTHNLGACLVLTALCALLARRKLLTSALFAVTFHLHVLMDVLGSRGPDGYQWPIPFLEPFSSGHPLLWSGQWELASWQNGTITVLLMGLTFHLARRRGFSFLEWIWPRGDRALVETIRRRFPLGEGRGPGEDAPSPAASPSPEDSHLPK